MGLFKKKPATGVVQISPDFGSASEPWRAMILLDNDLPSPGERYFGSRDAAEEWVDAELARSGFGERFEVKDFPETQLTTFRVRKLLNR